MRVRVLFFGILKDVAGRNDTEFDLSEGASVQDVLARCVTAFPRMEKLLNSSAVAVNQRYSDRETPLHGHDEVALLPPVSGGTQNVNQNASLKRPPDLSGSPASRAIIVRDRIDTAGVLGRIKRGEDGAAVVFEGVVRNQTHGRKTLYLDYEAYEEMALQQMKQLADQALQQFAIRDVAMVHRLGRFEIGETSVLVVVTSAHRGAAFEACRWLIDTLKRTVPIWKKEYFADGAVWADGEPFPDEILHGSAGSRGSPGKTDASK